MLTEKEIKKINKAKRQRCKDRGYWKRREERERSFWEKYLNMEPKIENENSIN